MARCARSATIFLAVVALISSSLVVTAHPSANQQNSDVEVVETDGQVHAGFDIQTANLLDVASVDKNEVEVFQPANDEQQQEVINKIVKDLQENFASMYQKEVQQKLADGEYPVRSLNPGNGIELNGKITGLQNVKLSKAFEASANKTNNLTAYSVKAEMEIPELIFEFDLVKYFPIDVFKLFPVRGKGKANMTATLPLEAKTQPNAQTSTTGCVAAVDSVARADNVRVDVTFTNALGRGLQWIRDHLNLDLADSVLSNFAKTIVDVVLSILQLIICGAIEAATKAVVLG